MKPDQEFIKKYTELYGEDIQFAKTSDDTVLAGTLGEDGKFYAVDSISGGKAKKGPKGKPTKMNELSRSVKKPVKKDDVVTAGATPQGELFNAVEKALKQQFDARIQAGHNPFEEFKIPTFFK
jgi:hypothetical protein